MKLRLQLLFVFCVMLGLSSMAQKKFTEGTISYDIVINTGSEKPKNADYLDGTTVANYIKGIKSRTEMVSPLGTVTTIHNSLKDTVVILQEFGGQKHLITLTQADWKDANKRNEGITYTYEDGEKTILGYKCKKAIGKLPDGTVYTVWYTPDLVLENKNFQYETRMLPGLAMEYEVDSKEQKVTYTVSKISFSPVPNSKFELPKSGFRVMTYSESKGGN